VKPGLVRGIVIGAVIGAVAVMAVGEVRAALTPSVPSHPVEIVLHRFDIAEGKDAKFDEWVSFLRDHHREAVATLPRERTYLEAMFRAPDEPSRLYWLTVQGAGGASVESSTHPIDHRHMEYMAEVLKPGTHARLVTRNVLMPDFVVKAIADDQRSEVRQ
jgi:hypothetical protein